MKNIVSKKTAEDLRDAGFPQPLPDFGQTWFDLDGQALILSKVIVIDKSYSNIKKVVCQSEDASHLKYDYGLFLSGEMIFAPTSDDLLNTLPPCYAATTPEKKWEVRAVSGTSFWSAIRELLVEAAAECWLVIKNGEKE